MVNCYNDLVSLYIQIIIIFKFFLLKLADIVDKKNLFLLEYNKLVNSHLIK